MNKWVALGIAIVSETIATSAMKSSEGFTRLVPSIIVIVGYMVAFYFLSITLKSIPVGIAYAIWSGVGLCWSRWLAGFCSVKSSTRPPSSG